MVVRGGVEATFELEGEGVPDNQDAPTFGVDDAAEDEADDGEDTEDPDIDDPSTGEGGDGL